MRKEPKYSQAIVDGYNHHAFTGKDLAVIRAGVGCAASKTSAVYPEHDGKAIFERFCRCPDVQVEAIFTQRRELGLINGRSGRIRRLPAGIGKLCSLAYAFPRSCRLWRFPAKIAYRRRCVRHTKIHAN